MRILRFSCFPGFVPLRFSVLGLLDWHLSNPSFAFQCFPVLGFAALPFLRFARTTATAIPATRIAPPVTANCKTWKPLFWFSEFARSRFCVFTFYPLFNGWRFGVAELPKRLVKPVSFCLFALSPFCQNYGNSGNKDRASSYDKRQNRETAFLVFQIRCFHVFLFQVF